MAYLGNDLQVAFPVYRNIDDISGSFNSSTTSFPLRVSGVAPVPAPLYSQQCLISVGGVVQRPDDTGSEGFRLSGGNIIFASAPTTGADFFGVILAGADYINAGGNFPSGTAAVPSITFNDDLDTGIYNSGINQVSITTGGSERLRIDSAGQIESVSLGTAAAPAFSFTTDPNSGIYSPGADQVAISTNGTGRLFVDASGNVGLGSASPTSRLQSAGTIHITSGGTPGSGAGLEIGYGSAAASTTSLISYNRTGAAWLDADYRSLTHQFFTSGSERLRITSAGLVGVGTSSPTTLLTVQGTTLIRNTERLAFNTYESDTVHAGYIGRNTSTGALEIASQNIGANYPINLITANTSRLHITAAGLVGVGTSSPSQNLHVNSGGHTVLLVSSSFSGSTETAVRIDTVGDTSRANVYFSKSGTNRGSIIYNHSATGTSESLNFNVSGGTDKLTITGAGNVGIGTVSPGSILQCNSATGVDTYVRTTNSNATGGFDFGVSGGGDAYIFNRNNKPLIFGTNSAEMARIDSSGRLLVGTSSAITTILDSPKLQVFVGDQGCASFIRGSNNEFGPNLHLVKSRNTSPGSRTILQSGDELGSIFFIGDDGLDLDQTAARIHAHVDGTPGANDMPGRLVFSTTADGASSPSERMRISNNGYVGINGTATRRLEVLETRASEFAAAITNSSATGHSLALVCNSSDTVGKYLDGYSSSASITRIAIFSNGNVVNTNNSYGAISDARLKENIADASSQWDDIKAVQVRNYNLKTDPDHRQIGVVAQEIEQVSPGLVYECPDRDAEGNDLGTVTKSVNYSVLYMKAVKALQEAMERIETLEAKVAALESA